MFNTHGISSPLTRPEKADDLVYTDAASRNIELMAQELAAFGSVSHEVREMILDEELTHAVEILAAQENAYAVVPRHFYKAGNDLVDKHHQSLIKVLDGGIGSIRKDIGGVPGAEWELKRRQAERGNLDKIIAMPAGTMLVEISIPPIDKPEAEREAQHYNDLTMIRASIKDKIYPDRVTQYGFVLPVTNPEFIVSLQEYLGTAADGRIDSQKILEEPIIRSVDQPADSAAKEIDNLIGAALLESSVGHGAVRMIRRAVEKRREAWDFVSSEAHSDLHRALLSDMEFAARLPEKARTHAMDAIRTGFWKEYKDRFNNRLHGVSAGSIIAEAASRSVADGDVFIACGSTVKATEFSAQESAASRAQMADTLMHEVAGSGTCSACGAKGVLFGCGVFCGACNKIWCDEYKNSGRQLDAKEIAYRTNSRPKAKAGSPGIFDELALYWQQITDESRRKQQLNKQKEAARRIKQQEKLAQAA